MLFIINKVHISVFWLEVWQPFHAGEDGLVNYIERRDKIRCASDACCLHLGIVSS